MISGAVSILGRVQLLITHYDGTEEVFDVTPQTKLRSVLKDGFWVFTPTTGGQVAMHQDDVKRVELGAVVHEDVTHGD